MYRCILAIARREREKGNKMKDTKKHELFDNMLRKYDAWNEACGTNKNSLFEDFSEAACQYASYTGCSYKYALNIPFMD